MNFRTAMGIGGGLASRRWIPAIGIAMLAIATAIPAHAANTLCVSPGGSFPPGLAKKLGCSATYQSIGLAVTAASANDTILVMKGTYSEGVTIPASLTGLTLIGQNPRNTIIDATNQANGILDQAGGVTISGFTIENAEHEGILVQGPPANCAGECIPAASEITGVTIQGNLIQDNDKALNTSTTPPTCPVAGSVPTPPTFEQEDCGEGLHLDGVAFSTVADNQISGNAGGILLTDETNANHDNLVSGNQVVDNVPDCGITLPSHPPNGDPANIGSPSFGVFNDTVANNLSQGNGAAGTGVFAPTPGTMSYKHLIIDNRLINNANPGVIFHSHTPGQKLNDTSIVGNFISGNGAEPNPGPNESNGPTDTTGIEVYADAAASPITGVKIVGNTIKNEGNDIWVGAPGWSNCSALELTSPCYNVDAHLNSFAPHSVGVNNQGSASAGGDVQVNATNNFWGCAKGPGNGPCASVKGNVLDFPFLFGPPGR